MDLSTAFFSKIMHLTNVPTDLLEEAKNLSAASDENGEVFLDIENIPEEVVLSKKMRQITNLAFKNDCGTVNLLG